MNQEETIHLHVVELDAGLIKAKLKHGHIKRTRKIEKEDSQDTAHLTEGLKREEAC